MCTTRALVRLGSVRSACVQRVCVYTEKSHMQISTSCCKVHSSIIRERVRAWRHCAQNVCKAHMLFSEKQKGHTCIKCIGVITMDTLLLMASDTAT